MLFAKLLSVSLGSENTRENLVTNATAETMLRKGRYQISVLINFVAFLHQVEGNSVERPEVVEDPATYNRHRIISG